MFQIQRVYLKDLSLEQPNSPPILLEQEQPQVDIQLASAAEAAEGIYEVCVTATVTTKVGRGRCSWWKPSRPASSRSATAARPDAGRSACIACPQILYPYLRAIVADVCTRAGFPPIHLAEINFQAMYEAQQAQARRATAQRQRQRAAHHRHLKASTRNAELPRRH